MKKLKFLILTTFALSAVFIFASCEKNTESSDKNATVRVMLTDAPALYDAVYIDVQEVQFNSETEGWISVPVTNPGVYNMLEFSNGMDTLLGIVEIPAGKLTQIRLILGNNNSVVVDGITYPLTIPSGSTSGLKLNIHQVLEPGITYRFWIDFDAALSIHQTGNGIYKLKPVIRMFTESTSGIITGNVFPLVSLPLITVLNAGDTMMAIPAVDGHFMIMGIPAGTYSVVYTSAFNPGLYPEIRIDNVVVVNGQSTNMDDVTLILP